MCEFDSTRSSRDEESASRTGGKQNIIYPRALIRSDNSVCYSADKQLALNHRDAEVCCRWTADTMSAVCGNMSTKSISLPSIIEQEHGFRLVLRTVSSGSSGRNGPLRVVRDDNRKAHVCV